MKTAILMSIWGAVGYIAGHYWGSQHHVVVEQNCPDRYELRDSGIVGALIRLDKQTGETKVISANVSAAQ